MHTLRLLPATALLVASLASAQSWTALTPTASPPGRNAHVLCTDTTRNVTVLYGHGDLSTVDTWEFDGKTWTKMSPTTSPPALGYAGLSFDSKRGVCVLFGGRNTSGRSNETWEYDGKTWTRIQTTSSPKARYGHGQCYDSIRGVTVVFSGLDTAPYHADTWEYDGKDWKQVATSGPPGRIYPTMAFDLVRGRSVLFSGYSSYTSPVDIQDTWEWDGKAWKELKLACQPEGRWGHAAAYVLARGVVVFGGQKQSAPNAGAKQDTWILDTNGWAEVKPQSPPSARRLHAMAIAATTSRVLLFGGTTGAAETQSLDLGVFAGGSYETYGAGCAGSNGTPTLASPNCGAPYINTAFTAEVTSVPSGASTILVFGLSNSSWSGATLPMDWSFMGFTGCSLLASIDLLVPMATTGTTASFTATLPNDTSLPGVRFYNQGFVFDKAANAAGATLSNGCTATVGRR